MTNQLAKQESKDPYAALPLWAILPGLIFILVVDLLTVMGWLGFAQVFLQTWSLVLAVIPWVTLIVVRGSPSMFGYTRGRGLSDYGWGMVAGGIWRGLSMAFNLWSGWTRIGWGFLGWIGALVFIPLVEETFFRGYLGRAFRLRVGSCSTPTKRFFASSEHAHISRYTYPKKRRISGKMLAKP